MTISKKKKKSSTSLRVSHPNAPHARAVRFHRKDGRTGMSRTLSIAPSESLGMLFSNHPESDNLLSEYIASQTDIQHNDPAEDNTGEEKEQSKQQARTKVMEDWLTYRDTYLQEMLRHDGREEPQVALCGCGKRGDYSCDDCAYCVYYCQSCLVNRHHFMPLHRIKVGFKLILSAI